ncbi:hypothetical protein [Foetidibacter luteolus]|uniref:hypothetical protein n=1 Tax=Foetidibacter luteolus TaxID=2608880 RepID=UPI001A98E045|nr:hypothetical protein [Foetidibacter luteolus]
MKYLLNTRQLLSTIKFLLMMLLFAIQSNAQTFDSPKPLTERVTPTPANAIKIFEEAEMHPYEHLLTQEERQAVVQAFELLPPLHQRILKEHLEGISFLDSMPNTALTSTIESGDSVKRFHISFRAGILKQTISQWLTEKEATCFTENNGDYKAHYNAGSMNAIVYVLLHETTHIVDGSLDIFHHSDGGFAKTFTGGVWKDRVSLETTDSLLSKNHFRRGKLYPYTLATSVYNRLQQTPFVSLYSTSSWSEDLAECLTVYHLTRRLKQPFQLFVSKKGKTIFSYEPVKNKRVFARMKALEQFYAAG